jgi:hypothetical protein
LQLQSLVGQLQAQVLENERVSGLKGELEERLLALGQQPESWGAGEE